MWCVHVTTNLKDGEEEDEWLKAGESLEGALKELRKHIEKYEKHYDPQPTSYLISLVP